MQTPSPSCPLFEFSKVGNYAIVIPSSCNSLPSVIFGPHCTPAGSGLHRPFLVQVMLMGCEGMSPSSHWKVTIAFSVVLDTSPSTLASEEIAGSPQSAVQHRNTIKTHYMKTHAHLKSRRETYQNSMRCHS